MKKDKSVSNIENLSDCIHISIISPVYKAEKLIDQLVLELLNNLKKVTTSFEIILVEDHSPDNSWERIKENCLQFSCVKGIKLSRNFGQHYAISAGLTAANGEWIIVMDCDLQDRPDQIVHLYNKALEGFDLVFARRTIRQDNFFKKLSSVLFYKVYSYLTETKLDYTVANYGIYHKKVIKEILIMEDRNRYFPSMLQWVGFRKAYVDILHGKREEGKSSYTFWSLLKLAWDNIISFSDKPLQLVTRFGFFMALLSGIIGAWYIYKHFIGEIDVQGFTSLMVSMWFLSGIIIFTLGIVGIYVGKTFESSKNRPLFIVEEKINF